MVVVDLDVCPGDHDYPHFVRPEGWQVGCRFEDREWIGYLCSDYPDPIDRLTDLVPAGFCSGTATFFAPSVEDERVTAWSWFAPGDANPWSAVEAIAENGISDNRYAADQSLDPVTGHALIDALDITGEDLYTCGYFMGHRAWTATGKALAAELSVDDDSGWDPPDLFFPHDRRWFAVLPYDFGWTYLASSHDIAERIRAHPDLVTLPCTM